MIYCVTAVDYARFIEDYSPMLSKKDIVVLDRSVIGRLDMTAELEGGSHQIKLLCALSRDKGILVLAAVRAIVGDDCFNSVLVVDDGRILGVSDELFPAGTYNCGRVLKLYRTSCGLISVLIGRDVLYSQLWQPILDSRPQYVFYLNPSLCSDTTLTMAKALAVSVGRNVLCSFLNEAEAIDANGRAVSIEIGCLRTFCASSLAVPPYVLERKIRFKIEQ